MTPSIILQLKEYIELAFMVIKPATVLYILLFLAIAKPVQVGTLKEQSLGIIYYILQAISFVLISTGAIAPLASFLSGEILNPEWYITFLCTFATGGLLYIWTDNAISNLPAPSTIVPRILFIGCVRIIGILTITFSLIMIAIITMKSGITWNWWVLPVVSVGYGLLLLWVTTDSTKMLRTQSVPAKPVRIDIAPEPRAKTSIKKRIVHTAATAHTKGTAAKKVRK